MNIENLVYEFLYFAKNKLFLNELDALYYSNFLFDILKYSPTSDFEIKENYNDVNYFANNFKEYLMNTLELDDVEAELKLGYIFGILTPLPSEVNKKFHELVNSGDKEGATSYLYNLGINSYYVQKQKIDQNIVWDATFENDPAIEISINLSKPEKNNKDIAKLLSATKETSYPKCLLCKENLGFFGTAKKASRENIRYAFFNYCNHDWFMQYSPYGYFDEHMILVDVEHRPMAITNEVLETLLLFVAEFPHYIIGSNSDLPIVGGSILNHEHFQGGKHIFPMMKAEPLFEIEDLYPDVNVYYLNFYNSTMLIKGKNYKDVLNASIKIKDAWATHTDAAVDIISEDELGRHNTVTPIARIVDGEYYMYLILRNNCCNETYPDGIFHAHPEYHAIKKEGIGLIEAMGRFVLPARLKRQLKQVDEVAALKLNKDEYLEKYPDLEPFESMINDLKLGKYPSSKEYVNEVCRNILRNTAVYKNDEQGKAALNRFVEVLRK